MYHVCAESVNNAEFIVAWLFMHQIRIPELELKKVANSYYIENQLILNLIQHDYTAFQLSCKSVADYFERDILLFTQNNSKTYNTSQTKCDKAPLIMVKKREKYQYGYKLTDLKASEPIEMTLDHILDIYDIPPDYEFEPVEVEEKYEVALHYYRMIDDTRNGKPIKIGIKDSSVPGNPWEEFPRTISIGVDEYYLNEPTKGKHYWLPRYIIFLDSFFGPLFLGSIMDR